MESETSSAVKNYYDDFAIQQGRTGINLRHLTIASKLKKEKLRDVQLILEVGCGIGTFTNLLSKQFSSGKIVAVDISPKSIEAAKQLNRGRSNIEFRISDMKTWVTNEKFDLIILPDVLEHIPADVHSNFFKLLSDISTSLATIIIHIPDPYFQEWSKIHQPEIMQIIDQSIYSDKLLEAAYGAGFYLHKLESYCLFHTLPDYQWIVLKKTPPKEFHKKSLSFRIADKYFKKLFS